MSAELRTMGGRVVLVCAAHGPRLDGERAATDIIGDAFGTGAEVVAIPVTRLAADFLVLRNRKAGEAIQKFVTYGFKVAFVGDVSAAVAASDALRDFVRESNRGGHVWFVDDMAGLEAKIQARG